MTDTSSKTTQLQQNNSTGDSCYPYECDEVHTSNNQERFEWQGARRNGDDRQAKAHFATINQSAFDVNRQATLETKSLSPEVGDNEPRENNRDLSNHKGGAGGTAGSVRCPINVRPD